MPDLATPEDLVLLVRQFESRELPKASWTHEAHFIVGLWYVVHQGPHAALASLRARIRAYNEAVGTLNSESSGYHETLTRLYVWAIAAQLALQPARGLWDQACSLLRSEVVDKAYPLRFYSRERLFSREARAAWLAPDLMPLPPLDAKLQSPADLETDAARP